MITVKFDLEDPIPRATLEAEADHVEATLKEHLLNRCGYDEHRAFVLLKQKFGMADYNCSGSVDQKEFAKLMKQFNVNKHSLVVQHAFDRYDSDDSDAITYAEFCNSLFGKNPIPVKKPGVAEAINTVRQKLLERGADSVNGLRRVFRLMDGNKSQKITQKEFIAGLARYGLDLDANTVNLVAAAFDRDGNGISQTEFMVALRGKLSDRRRDLVGRAFQQLDKDRTGVVEFAEIRRIYDATRHPEVLAGRMTVDEVLKNFIASWDRNADGTITLLEFIDYYKDISAMIEHEDYFELMIRNAWHMAGGEGWAANTSNLRVLVTHNDDSEEVVCILNDLGLDKNNDAQLRAALEDQGVKDIKTVSLAM